MTIKYLPRWKEMLDGIYGDHRFTVEITMGIIHVYFPTEETWERDAPAWAQGLWPQAKEDAQQWCAGNNTPFEVNPTAWVQFAA